MHRLSTFAVLAVAVGPLFGCGGSGGTPATDSNPQGPNPQGESPLAVLSDEFNDAASANQWSRVAVAEQWGFDQLEIFDVDPTRSGWLTMIPYSSGWYEDYRGVQA